MTVLVCGDRHWKDREAIRRELARLRWDTAIIHGGCEGADSLANDEAKALGLTRRAYKAQWERYRRAAGPIRNQQMLDEEHPTLVIAFHADLGKSKGTADMVRRARKAGIETRVILG